MSDTDRKCTNISSLFTCCGFVIVLFILVGYTGTKTDLDRLTKGYDDCGNVCGKKNEDLHFQNCSSIDMTTRPKTQVNMKKNGGVTIINYNCTEKCPQGFEEIFNRCIKKSDDPHEISSGTFFANVSKDFAILWPKLFLVCGVAAIFSYIVLILFRYAIEYIIWIIYIAFILALGAGCITFGVWYAKEKNNGLLWTSISFGISMLACILMIILYRRRIKLVAQLFKEAAKALMDITSILFEPILSFIALILAIVPFVFFIIVIETAGTPTEKLFGNEPHVEFEKNFGINFARFFNFIAFIWFTQFIFGCQHFIIGGTISKWYFARNKTKLGSPIWTTFKHLVCFHLGSVCLGSMLITLVKILRMIANSLKNDARESRNIFFMCLAYCLSCLIELLEEFLKYLIRNAYIIVAKDGTPLYESGKKAFNLIFDNLLDVIALNHFGDLVLVMARLFVMAISTLIAYSIMSIPEVTYVWVPVIFAGIFSFLIAHTFISVFEMIVDSIFICFCDDVKENTGKGPYYMSTELMEIMKAMKEEAGGSFTF